MNVVNCPCVRLEDSVLVLVGSSKPELVSDGGITGGHIRSDREMDFVKDVIVEVILVRSNAGLLERIDRERYIEKFRGAALGEEGIDVGRIRGRVQSNKRSIHVTGSSGRGRGEQSQREERGAAGTSDTKEFFKIHILAEFLLGWVVYLADTCGLAARRAADCLPRLCRSDGSNVCSLA